MRLTELTIHNFRSHEDLAVSLSARTIVRGQNAYGKSSLGEAIIWCLYGTDVDGTSKQDDRLMRRGASEMEVTLDCVKDDGQSVRITRSRDKGQVLQVGGKRQGAQQKVEAWFGTLPEFLTMFTPGYFSALEPKSARTVLARCLPILCKEDVIRRLQPDHRDILATHRYPMVDGVESLDFILEKTRREIRNCEDEQVRLEGEIRGLESVLTQDAPIAPTPLITRARQSEKDRLQAIVDAKVIDAATKEAQIATLGIQRASLRTAYEACKAQWQTVEANCAACGQSLQPDRMQTLRDTVEVKNDALRQQMDELIAQGNAVKAKLERLQHTTTTTDKPDALTQATLAQFSLDEQKDRRASAEYEAKREVRKQAQSRVKEAKQALALEAVRVKELKTRLQALEEYRFEYIRMQHEALHERFTHVRIDLVDANRETGEVRSVFRILWKGRPYRTLSQSEKIRCDVEIGRVMAAAREETMPVFVDNAESVQRLFGEAFSGQVIAAYVDQCELRIESLDDVRASA